MPEVDLPQRAKPELLHVICRLAREGRGINKSEVYDSIDANQKTLRKTLQYGVTLGFLEEEDEQYDLTSRGSGISYSSSFKGQEPVESAFREAIEDYPPYRAAIAGAYAEGRITTVKDNRAIEQDEFREFLKRSTDNKVQDRKVNLLIKTAEAAGLGEYVTGRRGYSSRLVLNGEFEEFASRLAEQYSLPSDEKDSDSKKERTTAESNQESDPETSISLEEVLTGNAKVTIEIDVSEMTDKERKVVFELLEGGST